MKLYAITVTSPLGGRTHMHFASREVAVFEAAGTRRGLMPGYSVEVTVVEVGKWRDALVSLANNPNWLTEREHVPVGRQT